LRSAACARALSLPICLGLLAAACGGGSAGPPPPKADFALVITPEATFAVTGNTTAPVVLSVAPQNGFSDSVTVTLQGVPQGVTVSPSSPFVLAAGQTRSLAFTVPAMAPVGIASITVLATSGALSHGAQLTLTTRAQPAVRTYQDGSVLYLESSSGSDTARIGLETKWGGSIVEVSLNGVNFVNAHDTGREVQPAFREGKDLNWNPTLGGDVYDQGTAIIAYMVSPDALSTQAQPLQWSPDFYGGGAGRPVPGDMLVEQTITAVTSQLNTFKVHYKATHLGRDLHANGIQELPAVYTNQDYSRFARYEDTSPWTYGATTATQFPILGTDGPLVYVPEHWGALVNGQTLGLTGFAPSNYPYAQGFMAPDPGAGGPTDNATNYFILQSYLTIAPGYVFEWDVYLIPGDYRDARQIIYWLHETQGAPDIFTATGATDSPSTGSTISGVTTVAGWAFDDLDVSKTEVLVDGAVDGTASYGATRPDIPAVFPHAPASVGFSYPLDTTKYPNAAHTLNVRVTDSSGNVAVFADVPVTVSN